jgi:catechol 2,3-dioxygenase-like lactoylglutathione lyase family enzyme
MTQARIVGEAPILFVKDIDRALAYWNEKVGFTIDGIHGEPNDFAILSRDKARLMLALAPEGHEIVPLWKVRTNMWNVYFWVDDAEALYAELNERGAIIDYELHDKPYNVREFGIRDLEDQDIAFGQVLNQQPSHA